MKLTICPYCKKPIENRDQLVTVSNMFRIRPYHYVCYQKVELETKAIWSLWTPLNGISGTVRFIILLGIAIWLLTTNQFGLIALETELAVTYYYDKKAEKIV